MMDIYIKQHLRMFEAQFIKKLGNTEIKFKKICNCGDIF